MVDIDLAATQSALREAAVRTANLLRSVPDGNIAVPGLSWTVAEAAAHLVSDADHYKGFITGERDAHRYLALAPNAHTPAERTVVGNAQLLKEFTERDLSRLTDQLIPAIESFIAAGGQRNPEERILTETGLSMTVPMMTAALLGEQLVHGLDIARAVKAGWPISPSDALFVIAGIMALVPEYVDRQRTAGLHLVYELRFRRGPRYRLEIDDGAATVGLAGRRVDCWISADPVSFLLVGFGRIGQWGPTLRGKIIAGGRKPWLGLKFGSLLTSV